jgi:hypothetical protein
MSPVLASTTDVMGHFRLLPRRRDVTRPCEWHLLGMNMQGL